MTIFDQLVSITRAATIQAGVRLERTNEEILQDLLVAEPALADARRTLLEAVEAGRLPKEVLE